MKDICLEVNKLTDKRFIELDIMRLIGFLLVVDQHILGAYSQKLDGSFFDLVILNFFYLIGRPAVPMFVAITAFTLYNANYSKFSFSVFYTKKIFAIVLPYLFWSFATILIFRKYSMLNDIIMVILTGTASYHLWYMGTLIRIYIWFPLARIFTVWLEKKEKIVKISALILFCIAYWMLLKNNNLITDGIAKTIFGTPTLLEKRIIQYSPIFWSIYFVAGASVWFNYESFKKNVVKYWVPIGLLYIPVTIYMFLAQSSKILGIEFSQVSYHHFLYILFMLMTILIVYIISVKISEHSKAKERLISEAGKLTFGAYLIHVIILQHVAIILKMMLPKLSYLPAGIIIFIITSFLAIIITYLLSFLPFSKYIIGIPTRKLKNI